MTKPSYVSILNKEKYGSNSKSATTYIPFKNKNPSDIGLENGFLGRLK
jgi:hypothetical protein